MEKTAKCFHCGTTRLKEDLDHFPTYTWRENKRTVNSNDAYFCRDKPCKHNEDMSHER